MSNPDTFDWNEPPPAEAPLRISFVKRLCTAFRVLAGLRRHDFRAAGTFRKALFPELSALAGWIHLVRWAWVQAFRAIPEAMTQTTFDTPISRTPFWLKDGNPWTNYPWQSDPDARLPEQAEVVVIGAGMAGAAVAHHWAKSAPPESLLVLIDMNDPGTGASGSGEGIVVLGRPFAEVRDSVRAHLDTIRRDLPSEQCDRLAAKFATAYCRAAYRNARLVEQTAKARGFECEYERNGWVQAVESRDQPLLMESVQTGCEAGFDDWIAISPGDAHERTGMQVWDTAGCSIGAASFNPAKFVWCLTGSALTSMNVELFTRTKAEAIEDAGDEYLVRTSRGVIRARYVVTTTEAHSALLHPQLRGKLFPVQTQVAAAEGGPESMKPHVGIGASCAFFSRQGSHVLMGSDATRVPDDEAGHTWPSRFITKFLCAEMQRYYPFDRFYLRVTHEWSATPGFTPDEFPIIGLLDGKRQYIIGGQCSAGTGISFNAARCICNRILGIADEVDDYPDEFFAPMRLIDPNSHWWPALEP